MSTKTKPSLAQATPALFVVLWSTGFIGARMGAPYSEPMTFLAMRFSLVLALLLPISLMLRAKWPTPKQAFHAFVTGLLIHGVYLACVFWAIDNGMPAGLAALVMGLQPVMTAFFARGILGERLTRNHLFGFILGLIGICLVLYPRLSGGDFSVTPPQIVVVCAAMLSISFGTVYQKRFAANLDMRAATIWQYLAACLLCAGLSFATETQTIVWSGEFIFALGWLTLVLSIGAIFLLLWLIEHGAVSNIAALFYMIPAVTAVISYLLFDEPITLMQILGIIITATGVLIASRTAR
ncbi:DMT family transporter [Cohaesibacter intestini]|uniref:DMT family transporter n=1 Tax=Cohaesibacter intestini TaxID=2211145 RepID=UPI000DE830AE|nr:DMT family transporter [Cohaesibacter intestini]